MIEKKSGSDRWSAFFDRQEESGKKQAILLNIHRSNKIILCIFIYLLIVLWYYLNRNIVLIVGEVK